MDWTLEIAMLAGLGLTGCFTPDTAQDTDPGSTGGEDATSQGPSSNTSPTTTTPGSTTEPSATASTGVDTTGADESTSSGEEGSTTSTAVCPETHICVPEVPPDWTGPVIFYEGSDAAPDCPAEYPGLELDANDDLTADGATCGCECDATGLCGRMTFSHLGSCQFPALLHATDWVTTPDSCTPLQEPIDATHLNVGFHEEEQSGSCAEVFDVDIPPTQWNTNARVCGGPSLPEGCGGGELCAPLPSSEFETSVCVYRQGVSGCPLEFPVPHPYFTDIDDTRGCSECTCGDVETPVECNATVRLSSQADCSTQAVADFFVDAPVCQPKNSAMDFARITDLQLTLGGCTATGGEAQGAATPAGDVTVCCVPTA